MKFRSNDVGEADAVGEFRGILDLLSFCPPYPIHYLLLHSNLGAAQRL
jgi:hypothetical protein